MIQLEPWFMSWVPHSVFSAGKGRSSVEAWFSTALDIEERLVGGAEDDVHLLVADVVKSFDTVDRGFLDRVLSSLGLPAWFRHTYFEFYAKVRLRFKLAAGLGEPWTRDGGIPQGCLLSMMFVVCRHAPHNFNFDSHHRSPPPTAQLLHLSSALSYTRDHHSNALALAQDASLKRHVTPSAYHIHPTW